MCRAINSGAVLRASSNDVKTVVICTTKNRPGMLASVQTDTDTAGVPLMRRAIPQGNMS